MKTLLIASFDILRPHDPRLSYSIASLLANSRRHDSVQRGLLKVHHISFNLCENPSLTANEACRSIQAGFDPGQIDFIALSAYVWSEPVISALMPLLRQSGFAGSFILGGYQITSTAPQDLPVIYPEADFFIKGYAEAPLMKIVTGAPPGGTVLEAAPDLDCMPSPYLDGVIALSGERPISMLRWETKRGCPFSCGFCEWSSADSKRVIELPLERLEAELDLFRHYRIQKVNVLDPTFNIGSTYMRVARIMAKLDCLFSVQARFEQLAGEEGREFLSICRSGGIRLELGLQTIIDSEMRAIGRVNDMQAVRRSLEALEEFKVPFEVSLIFGIPGQTARSFMSSVSFLLNHGCSDIQCFPLRIPRGSRLERDASANCVKEAESISNYSISNVVSSFSFDEDDWAEMSVIAESISLKRDRSFILLKKEGLSWVICGVLGRLPITAASSELPAELSVEEFTALAGTRDSHADGFCYWDDGLYRAAFKHLDRDCLVWLLKKV